ncbi:MAG: hypothetical protein GWP06_16735 [Actinobacteria bacterium]|nr:hypothetical protein [Actinomycetota bacterium]
MSENVKKSLDKKEGIKGFVRGKVEEYNLENGAQACIDEVETLLEFLENEYSNKCFYLEELRDHLTELFLE